jgi:hypothetical protein
MTAYRDRRLPENKGAFPGPQSQCTRAGAISCGRNSLSASDPTFACRGVKCKRLINLRSATKGRFLQCLSTTSGRARHSGVHKLSISERGGVPR